MKKFLILLLLVFLTGCVTYYQPETALENGVYYAEDDPSYVLNSSDYSGVIVYPWSSLDYFYLGYGAYYGHHFAYGYPFAWGYPPFGYPYGHYSRYPPAYFSPRWRPYRGYCVQQHNCRRNHRSDGDEFYAQDDGGTRQGRDVASEHEEDFTQGGGSDDGSNDNASIRRYVTTTPNAYYGKQGMVVRNSANSKMGQSHNLEPSKSTTARSSGVSISSPSPAVRSSARSAANTSSGSRARSSSVSPSSGRQSSTRSKSTRRRDRD